MRWCRSRSRRGSRGSLKLFAYPFSDHVNSGLLGDAEVESLFSADAMLRRMLDFEAALTRALDAEGEITEGICTRTVACIGSMKLDIDRISLAAARDGVVVPELVNQVRQALPEDCRRDFHGRTQSGPDHTPCIALRNFHDIVRGRPVP